MPTTATQTTILAVTLLNAPFSAFDARYQVRTTLHQHDLDDYASDAAAITSELVTNAITHTDTRKIGLELTRQQYTGTLTITVTDSSPNPPEKFDAADVVEHGRGLNIVEALSARWGWRPKDTGKAVYAILATKGLMEAISDLPMLDDIDADYSPQYVKLARILRAKIESGEHRHGDALASAHLSRDFNVSMKVACNALAMLAANRYVARRGDFKPYQVTWQAGAL